MTARRDRDGGDEPTASIKGPISAPAPQEGAGGASSGSSSARPEAGNTPPSGPLWTVIRTMNAWLLVLVVLVYTGAFWVSISDLPSDAAGYPRAIIVVLLAFVTFGVASDLVKRARGSSVEEVVEDDDMPPIPTDRYGLAAVWERWRKTILTGLVTVAYLYVMPTLGYYETTTVYLTVLFVLLGLRRPLLLVPTVLVTMALSWLLFAQILGVRTPSGPLIG